MAEDLSEEDIVVSQRRAVGYPVTALVASLAGVMGMGGMAPAIGLIGG